MSMLQIEELLKPDPLLKQFANAQHIYYFVYSDHLNWEEFKDKYPEAERIGIAWLPCWTWHINANGETSLIDHISILIQYR
jgi:hypothetical protein